MKEIPEETLSLKSRCANQRADNKCFSFIFLLKPQSLLVIIGITLL